MGSERVDTEAWMPVKSPKIPLTPIAAGGLFCIGSCTRTLFEKSAWRTTFSTDPSAPLGPPWPPGSSVGAGGSPKTPPRCSPDSRQTLQMSPDVPKTPQVLHFGPQGSPQDPPRPPFWTPRLPQGTPMTPFWTPRVPQGLHLDTFGSPRLPFCRRAPKFSISDLKRPPKGSILAGFCHLRYYFGGVFSSSFFFRIPWGLLPLRTPRRRGVYPRW